MPSLPWLTDRTESQNMLTDINELKKYVLDNVGVPVDESKLLAADEKMLEEAKAMEAEEEKMKPDVKGARYVVATCTCTYSMCVP